MTHAAPFVSIETMALKLRHADLEPETTGDPTDDVGAEDDPKAAWDDDPPALDLVTLPAGPVLPGGLQARSYALLRASGTSPADAAAMVGTPRPRPLAKTRPRATT